jgi:Flp pilus assembly protein TadD
VTNIRAKWILSLIVLILIIIIVEGQEQTVEYWLEKGNEFYNKSSYELAENCYSKALELDSKNVSAWCKKGISLINLNKINESISASNEAIKLEPTNPFVWESKALIFYGIANRNKILEEINETKDDYIPKDNSTIIQRLDGAVGHKKVWENYIDVDNNTKRIATSLYSDTDADCDILFLFEDNNDEPVDAILGYGNLGPIEAVNPEIGLWKVRVYGYNVPDEEITFHINLIHQTCLPDRYNESLMYLDRAIKLDPKRTSFINNKAFILAESYRFNEAMSVIDYSIKINPLNEYTWATKGKIFQKQRRYEEALQYFNNAIDLNPNYLAAWSEKAEVLEKLGRTDEANEIKAMIDEFS